jgi:serine/threonine-protein kinase
VKSVDAQYPGERVGHFEIRERLGAGNMGEVYKAFDSKLARLVALKFLPRHLSNDAKRKNRLLHEARAAAALDHVHIGTVHGIEETPDGRLFIVMAFYRGRPLSEILRMRRLPVEDALAIVRQIGAGLAAAHRRDIVHRDIKPSNVIITPDGLAKIVDFGLARFSGSDHLTRAGAAVGTAAYMAPEQALGHEVDRRVDIWALAVVLCEMLTGHRPFRGDTEHALLYKIVHEPPAIESIEIPPALIPVLHKGLAKDPASRYARVEDFLAELGPATLNDRIEVPTETLSSSIFPAPHQGTEVATARRPRAAIWISSAVLAALLAAIAVIPSWRSAAARWILNRVPAASERHIVVLPFRNIGNDAGSAELGDGLAEVLTSRLGGLERTAPSLWVIPSSEVRRKKVSSEEQARRALGATLAISGSVQKSGGGVQLILNLVDTRTLRLVGSRVLKSPAGNLEAVEDDAVKSIADLLAITVNTDPSRPTATPEAYENYIRAEGLLRRSDRPENVESALRDLNQAVEQDPSFALAYARLSEGYWARWVVTKDPKWLDAAAENAKKALRLDAQLALAYVALARAHEASQTPELAIEELQRALQLDPRNADAMRGLARVWERQGRIADADSMFQRAIGLHPEYWAGHNDYALFLARQGHPQQAEREYRRVIELAPDDANAYSNLGALYVSEHRAEEARALFEKSVSLSPSYFALANLGTVLDNQGQTLEAASKYERALQLNDKDYRVWASLATVYEKLHDPRARSTLEHADRMAAAALSREPDSPVILSQLSFYESKLGRHGQSVELARKATLLAPADTQVLLRAARTFELEGMHDEALRNVGAALAHGASPANIDSTDMKNLKADPRFAELAKIPLANKKTGLE